MIFALRKRTIMNRFAYKANTNISELLQVYFELIQSAIFPTTSFSKPLKP